MTKCNISLPCIACLGASSPVAILQKLVVHFHLTALTSRNQCGVLCSRDASSALSSMNADEEREEVSLEIFFLRTILPASLKSSDG